MPNHPEARPARVTIVRTIERDVRGLARSLVLVDCVFAGGRLWWVGHERRVPLVPPADDAPPAAAPWVA